MTDRTPQRASGADAARQALAAWKAGRTPGQAPAKKKPRRIREDRTGGRDPIGLAALLGRINDEQGWAIGLTGGNLIDQWAALCPDRYRGHLEPVAFHTEQGQLDIRPDSHAYATELRMCAPILVRELNQKLGRIAVRNIRVLTVGAVANTPRPETERPPLEQPAAPVRTRDTASPGYRQALETALAHKPDRTRHLNPIAAAAIDRQNQALTEHREPEEAFTDAVAEQERLEALAERQQSADPLEAAVRAALAYKHSGGSTPPVRRLFEAS